jgi:phosphoglycolate phosphatase-like HAD superfamily hydrolase
MLFVFDFDGVLADSSAACLGVVRRVQAEMGGAPVPADLWDRLDEVRFAAIADVLEVPEDRQPEFLRRVLAHMTAGSYRPALFAGIAGALRQLSRQGPIAILSASPRVVIDGALDRGGVAATVKAVRDGRSAGGKTAELPRILGQFGTAAIEAVMIGDAVSDIQAGRANGLRTVAVTWGWQSRARLEAMRPDRLLSRVEELHDLPAWLAAEGSVGHTGA